MKTVVDSIGMFATFFALMSFAKGEILKGFLFVAGAMFCAHLLWRMKRNE